MSPRKQQLDLVFLVDCTGSMGSYIQAAKDNILAIARRVATPARDLRFGLVCYRDHPPEDTSFVTRVFPFTSALPEMQAHVDWMRADGGGDGPECVTDGLAELLALDWRSDAAKVVVWIGDAPPHGIEPGDRWAACPAGHDPLEIARKLAWNGVVVYAVACEPDLGEYYAFGRDFYAAIARITTGRFVPLAGAHLLPPLITGAAEEEADLEGLMAELADHVAGDEKAGDEKAGDEKAGDEKAGDEEDLDEEALVERVTAAFHARRVTTTQVEVDAIVEEAALPAVACFTSAENLAEAKKDLPEVHPRRHAPPVVPARLAPSHPVPLPGASPETLEGTASPEPVAGRRGRRAKVKRSGVARAGPPLASVAPGEVPGETRPLSPDETGSRQEVHTKEDLISEDQVRRLLRRFKKRKKK